MTRDFVVDPLDRGGNGGLPVPQHHFVLGDASPFVFELGHRADWSRIIWAAHFGEDCINFTGSGQGGAIAAVFDISLTMAATAFLQATPTAAGGAKNAYCVTASLNTQFKRPATPIPGVFKARYHPAHGARCSPTNAARL